MADVFTVLAGGQQWTAFEHVSVEAAVNDAARSFQLQVAAEVGAEATAWAFKAGTALQILVNGTLLVDGYVDRYQPRLSADQASVSIAGRSKAQDAIDSSAIHETGRFENQTPLDIAKALNKFGIDFKASEAMQKVPRFQLTPGETVFRAVEKLARAQGFTPRGTPAGIEFWKATSPPRQAGAIIEGQNIFTGSADHNWSKRHSHTHVRGQRTRGHGAEDLQIEAIAKDQAVNRYRPLILVQDDDTDKTRAKGRAKTRRDRAAGHSLSAGIEMQGAADSGGQLWEPGNLVYVESPFLAIQQDMLIERVSWSQTATSGTITSLLLVDPRAYGGKKGKGSKSGPAWNATTEDPD